MRERTSRRRLAQGIFTKVDDNESPCRTVNIGRPTQISINWRRLVSAMLLLLLLRITNYCGTKRCSGGLRPPRRYKKRAAL